MVADSHQSWPRSLDWWTNQGIFALSISGGTYDDARQAVEEYHCKHYIVLMGGNDFVLGPAEVASDNAKSVIRRILDKPGVLSVVTGFIVPRVVNQAWNDFACKFEVMMTQQDPRHHHFQSDILLDSNRTGLDRSLYAHDLVHLNFRGNFEYQRVLEFAVSGVNTGVFTGGRQISSRNRPNGRTDVYHAHWRY